MKNFTTSLFLLFTIFQLKSQDAVFSQFYLSPLNLNPALAGAECGDQLIVNYRDQWRNTLKSAAYRMGSFSYDRPFELKNGDRIGIGARFLIDRAGSFNFQRTTGAVAFSYQKRIFQKRENTHFLVGGIESGLSQRKIDLTKVFIIAAEDPSEFSQSESNFYPELGFGLNYRMESQDDINLDFGFAVFHANAPNYTFSDSIKAILPARYVFHGQLDLPVTARFDIRPRVLYTAQSSSDFWIADLGFRFFMNKQATHSLEISAGGKLQGNVGVNTLLISGAYFYKNIGFSIMTEFNGDELNGERIDSYEGAMIYRFCK